MYGHQADQNDHGLPEETTTGEGGADFQRVSFFQRINRINLIGTIQFSF